MTSHCRRWLRGLSTRCYWQWQAGKSRLNPVSTQHDDEFLDDESLFGVQLNDVAVCLIHRALKAYHDQWAGGDPWEQAEIKTLKDYFFTLMLEVTMDVDADRMS